MNAGYLELGSAHELERLLGAMGMRSKRRVTAKGRTLGDKPFSRGALFHLLRNRIYLGMIVHKDQVHPGQHPEIQRAILEGRQPQGLTLKRLVDWEPPLDWSEQARELKALAGN